MKTNVAFLSATRAFCCLAWLFPSFCFATSITIGPGRDFPAIQEAINAAKEGDELIVYPDTYLENIHLSGKNIVLRSSHPTSSSVVAETIIDGGRAGAVVTFSGTEETSCVITGFTITHGNAQYGAGICGNGCLAAIKFNQVLLNFEEDTYDSEVSYGGGVYDCDGLIQFNIITNNTANLGGGLYGCDGLIQNNIISTNSVNPYFPEEGWKPNQGRGGGLNNCNGIIENNTIWGNAAGVGAGMLDCNAAIKNCIIWNNSYGSVFSSREPVYSCIQSWGLGGEGNLSADPMLRDPEEGDFHLLPNSPCIDAGGKVELSRDMDQDPRPYDSVNWETRGDGSDYDIGADEYPACADFTPTPTPSPTITPTPSPTITPTPTPNFTPHIQLITPRFKEEITTGTYTILWEDEDPDDDASISLFYIDYATGTGDTLIKGGISEDDEGDSYLWNLETVPEGIFQVYGLIDDGVNPPVKSLSPGTLVVIHFQAGELIDHFTGRRTIPPARLVFADLNQDGIVDVADFIWSLIPIQEQVQSIKEVRP